MCVRGLSGRELTNAIYHKKQKLPQWLREYYDGKVKYSKDMTPEQKAEFLDNMLSPEGYESDYFKRLKATIHDDVDKVDHVWQSWAQVTANMDSEAAKLAVCRGVCVRQ